MLNRSASLAMSTSVLKALPGKLDIKRHSLNILYIPIENISRVIDEPLNPLLTRTIGHCTIVGEKIS